MGDPPILPSISLPSQILIEGLGKLKTLLYNDTEYIIGIWHSKLHGI